MTKFFSFLICLVVPSFMASQVRTISSFYVSDGLPSNTVYTIFQDSTRQIWLGTDRGLVKYNGETFTTYDLSDGLEDLELFCINQDLEGRIWFGGFNGRICFIEDGVIHNSQTDPWLGQIGLVNIIRNIHIDKEGRIWCCDESGNVAVIEGNSSFIQHFPYSTMTFLESHEGELYGKPYLSGEAASLLAKFQLREGQIDQQIIPFTFDFLHNNFNQKQKRLYYESQCPPLQFDSEQLSQFKDIPLTPWELRVLETDHFICYASIHDGFYLREKTESSLVDIDLSTNSTVSKIMEDHQGNLWVSLVGDGLREIVKSKIQLTGPNFFSKNITSLHAVHDSLLLVGTNNGELFIHNDRQTNLRSDLEENGRILEIVNSSDSLIIATDGFLFSFNMHSQEFNKLSELRAWKHLQMVDGVLHASTNRGYYTSAKWEDDPLWSGRSLCFHAFDSVKTVIGGIRELVQWSKGASIEKIHSSGLGFANINFLAPSYDNAQLFVCTSGNGLVIITLSSLSEEVIDQSNGLEGTDIKDLFQPNDSTLWLATNKGLSILKKQGLKWKFRRNFNINFGAGSNDLQSIEVMGKWLFLGSSNGLFQIQQSTLETTPYVAQIYCESIELTDTTYFHPHEGISIDQAKNEIAFSFRNDDYSKQFRSWETMLEPLQESWTTTSFSSISFQELPSGDYSFKVRNNQEEGNTVLSIPFSIVPPFYSSTTFKVSLTVVISLVVWLIYRVRTKRKLALTALHLKNLESEQQSLFNQMNPHFIHNSLFAIQGNILKNDRIKANKLLVSFSNLMEKMLFSSKERSNSIQDEISLITEYLEWQRNRLDNTFVYDINATSVDLVLHRRIPSMILQPLVENAVEHGVAGIKEHETTGVIQLTLTLLNNGIECTLMNTSSITKQPDHQSSLGISLDIIQNRLSILKQMGYDASIHTARIDECKTIVTLHLPFIAHL